MMEDEGGKGRDRKRVGRRWEGRREGHVKVG